MNRFSHSRLVDTIKDNQREDPQFKRAWNAYCDEHSDGTRDPSRHDATFLKAALRELGIRPSGGRKGGRGGAPEGRGRGGYAHTEDMHYYVSTVRKHQKDATWQKDWCAYCDEHGEGTYDPSLHDARFLQCALDDIGAPGLPPKSNQTEEQQKLVALVKENQRDAAWHTRWADYCHENGEGTRDPCRHSAVFLKAALNALDRNPEEDEKHRVLVQQVKEYQKSNPAWNAHWSRHCEKYSDGTRDPAYHETSFLESAMGAIQEYMDDEGEHMKLVNKIKEMQREDTTWRTRWADYCTEYGEGTRDPAFHDMAFLKRALRDLGPEDEEHRTGLRSSASNHAMLVQEIKNMQRSDIKKQQKWVEYCGNRSDGTLDPAQHDAGFLRRALREISGSGRRQETVTNQRHQEIQLLCEARRTAQRARAFERADTLRTMLWNMGVEINDKKRVWRSDDGLTGCFNDPGEPAVDRPYHEEKPPRRGGRGGKGGK